MTKMTGLEKGAAICTSVVAVGAVSSSAGGLLTVAEMAHLPVLVIAGVTIPIGGIGFIGFIDGTAFAAGMMRRARKIWQATVLMASAVLVSMVAQAVAEVVKATKMPEAERPNVWMLAFTASIHVLGPAFAWGITETLLIFLRPEPKKITPQSGASATKDRTTTRATRAATGATSPPPPALPAQVEVSAGGAPLRGEPAEAGRKGEEGPVPTPPPPASQPPFLVPEAKDGDMELVGQISDWLVREGKVDVGRPAVEDAVKAITGRRPGTGRAERLLKLYRVHGHTRQSVAEGQQG